MAENKKKLIMIVEDDSFVLDIYQTKITKAGYDVVTAVNGAEAIQKLEEGVRPDLILLDIIMPYMNGLTVLKKIKSDERLKAIPVIMLTNLSQKEEVTQGFDSGASDYLIKSHFTPSEVMEKISTYIK